MGNAEIEIQALLELGMSQTGKMGDGDVIHVLKADKKNCLVGESKIYFSQGKMVQDMILRLRDVECGEVELRLELTNSKIGK